jgi:hypothetical protein
MDVNTRNSVNGDNRHRYRAPYGPITPGSSTGPTRRISTFVLSAIYSLHYLISCTLISLLSLIQSTNLTNRLKLTQL